MLVATIRTINAIGDVNPMWGLRRNRLPATCLAGTHKESRLPRAPLRVAAKRWTRPNSTTGAHSAVDSHR